MARPSLRYGSQHCGQTDSIGPQAEGNMGKDIRKQLRDKGREIQEHLADVGQTARRNVKEGLQSAVSGEPRYFGGPPSGRPPSARAPRAPRRPRADWTRFRA